MQQIYEANHDRTTENDINFTADTARDIFIEFLDSQIPK